MSEPDILDQTASEQQEGSGEEEDTSKPCVFAEGLCFPSSVDYHIHTHFHKGKRWGGGVHQLTVGGTTSYIPLLYHIQFSSDKRETAIILVN